jgi:hypothetical protein
MTVGAGGGGGQPLVHAWPAGQHVSEAPLPQGVVLLGQPHVFVAALAQATPDGQQALPHSDVPVGQQPPVDGRTQ